MSVSESFVVEAHEMQNGGMEVMDMDFVGLSAHAMFVGGAVDGTAFDSCPGKP